MCGTGRSTNKTAWLATRTVCVLVSRPTSAIGGAYHWMITSCEFSAVSWRSFIDLYAPFLVARQKLTNVWSCKVLCGLSGVLCGPVQSFVVLCGPLRCLVLPVFIASSVIPPNQSFNPPKRLLGFGSLWQRLDYTKAGMTTWPHVVLMKRNTSTRTWLGTIPYLRRTL